MRRTEVSPDPDSAPRSVTLPAAWEESAAAALSALGGKGPVDLAGALAQAESSPVLVDCLTLWLTNLMLAGHDIAVATAALQAALDRRAAPTILVSNEVGLGIVPGTPLGRAFRDEAGLLNQRTAARADRVLLMVAGAYCLTRSLEELLCLSRMGRRQLLAPQQVSIAFEVAIDGVV